MYAKKRNFYGIFDDKRQSLDFFDSQSNDILNSN